MTGLFMQPVCAELLFRQGLRNFGDFFRYRDGEVVCGHHARNVTRVNIAGIQAFLKREYFIPWKDYFHSWWAGFGFVSKSQREWQVLRALQACGIPFPEPLAVGAQEGKAFLLVRDLPETQDLPTALTQDWRNRADRVWLGHLLGKAMSDLHAAGFTHSDLYAKHVFVSRSRETIAFVDFQRTRRHSRVSWRRRWRDLAALNASLGDDLVSPRERLLGLSAYLRHVRQMTSRAPEGSPPMPRAEWRELVRSSLRMIGRRTRQLLRRSRVRRMRDSETTNRGALIVDYWRIAVRGLEAADAEPAGHDVARDLGGTGR